MNEKINKIFIPIIPMGAVRTTRAAAGWGNKSMMKYAAYKKQIGYITKQYFKTPLETPILVDVTFYMPIPNSWNQKKKDSKLGAFHTSKPDIDNLLKGCFDALNKIAWKDDNQVCEVHSSKVYSINPGIAIELWELDENGEKTKSLQQTAKGEKTDSTR